jgi:hypothetical protein
MNSLPRKKAVVRLFTGRLVGLPPEPQSERLKSVPIQAPTTPSLDDIADLEQSILAKVDKRGRPKKYATPAEKQAAYRARKADKAATEQRKKDLEEEIAFILHENRDDRGRLHGEISGGNVVGTADYSRRKARPATDGVAFEKGTHKLWKEKIAHWANRQNYFAPSKWDKSEKDAFAEALANHFCIEIEPDLTDVEYDEPQPKSTFVCGFKDFESYSHADVIRHFLKYHRRYILAEISYAEPHPVELLKKKPTGCSQADHDRWAQVFADRLPARCRLCKELIYSANNFVTAPPNSEKDS